MARHWGSFISWEHLQGAAAFPILLCWEVSLRLIPFNKHHTDGGKSTWKMLLFSFTQPSAATFKREIRKLYHCVKIHLETESENNHSLRENSIQFQE